MPEETQPETPAIKPTKQELLVQRKTDDMRLKKAEIVATQTTSILDPIAYAQMKNLAQDLINGGAGTADADTPEKMLVKLQAGYELGMSPIQSQNSLYIVNGRVTIWGAAMISRLRLAGWQIKFVEESADSCSVLLTKGDEVIEDTFKYQDAIDSGYTQGKSGEKIGWRKGQNRKLKLRYGVISQVVKTYLAEVLGSIAGVAEIDQDAPEITVIDQKDRMAEAEAERKKLTGGNFTPKPVSVETGE